MQLPTEELTGERIHFPNLDGLRFLAFFLVYLQHGFGLANAAGAGVAFFFVLSGFLITYLILVEVDRKGQVDVLAFYVRRSLRIWPLYFSVLAFAFVVYPTLKTLAGFSGYVQNGGPLLYLFFLGNFDVLRFSGVDGAGSTNILWSVSIEEQFYFLWPLLFRVVQPKRFIAIFMTVIGASFAFRMIHANDGPILYFHSLSVISDMAVGGLAAYMWRREPRFRLFFSSLPRPVIVTGYLVASWFLCTQPLWGPYGRLLAAAFFAFVVLEQNFCRRSIVKMSRSTLLSELGRYTYGLYMLHAIILTLLERSLLLLHVDPKVFPWRLFLGSLGLVLSIALAKTSFLYFESPFLRVKDRFSRINLAHQSAGTAG